MATVARTVKILDLLLGPGSVEGKTIVDVGANIGTTTVTALRSHPFARAVACEPEPANQRLLRVNLALNDLIDVTTMVPAAISNTIGTAQLRVRTDNSGAHSVNAVGSTDGDGTGSGAIAVESLTLDALVERGVIDPAQVGLLWMDAQGHEGHILDGASGLLEHAPPILMEIDPPTLDACGGREMLERAIARYYSHFIDMRGARGDITTADIALKPVAELPDLIATLSEDAATRFTDILVLKLEGREAPGER